MSFSTPFSFPSQFTPIIKSANQDVTNNTNQDDTELQFPTVSGGLYVVEACLYVSGNNATGDFAFRFAVAANTIDGRGTIIGLTTADAIQTAIITAAAAANTGSISIGTTTDLGVMTAVRVSFPFRQNTGATTFKVQFGNASAAAGRTSRMCKGSWLCYAQVA